MRLIFMGTPDFAVPCLARALADGHEIALVMTQPDKPKGRGYEVSPPPVKVFAMEHGLEVYQPATLKNNEEAVRRIAACDADVAVVVAYGRILRQDILDIPRYGCINVHASLLPRYRGAAPIQYAVLNGDEQSGVTTMLLDAGIDTGDMLLSRKVPIPEAMTAGELHDILMDEGAQAMSDTLAAISGGTIKRIPQDNAAATHAPMLSRELSPLTLTMPARELHNRVRGLNPWPSAQITAKGKTLKIHRSAVAETAASAAPAGTVLAVSPLTIACGEGTGLVLIEVQPEGTRRMTGEEYARGRRLQPGDNIH